MAGSRGGFVFFANESPQDSRENHNLQAAMTDHESSQELHYLVEDYEGRSRTWDFKNRFLSSLTTEEDKEDLPMEAEIPQDCQGSRDLQEAMTEYESSQELHKIMKDHEGRSRNSDFYNRFLPSPTKEVDKEDKPVEAEIPQDCQGSRDLQKAITKNESTVEEDEVQPVEVDEIKEPGTFRCSRPKCYTCRYIVSHTRIAGPKSSLKITDSFDCTSSNVVYSIKCSCCNLLYISETGRRLGDRIREHLNDVRKNDSTKAVARHFNSFNHCLSHFTVFGLSSVSGDKSCRKAKEMQLIDQLGTLNPTGMNERFTKNIKNITKSSEKWSEGREVSKELTESPSPTFDFLMPNELSTHILFSTGNSDGIILDD